MSHSGSRFAYLFEAKGIQRYIFEGGRLRDLIGGSELVATITAPDDEGKSIKDPKKKLGKAAALVDSVVKTCGLKIDEESFSRKAGGAFMLHGSTRELATARALMRLAIGVTRPGLEISDAIAEGIDDFAAAKSAYQQGSGARENSAAALPPAGGPACLFNPRTGRPASAIVVYTKGGQGGSPVKVTPALMDALHHPLRRRGDKLQSVINDGVARRCLEKPDAADERGHPYIFPRNLDSTDADVEGNPHFPFRGRDERIGVVHADVSGLGKIYSDAREAKQGNGRISTAADAKLLSGEIEKVIERAAQQAVKAVLLPKSGPWPNAAAPNLAVVPARPVVLGGDDITFIVRADLAVNFAAELLRQLETCSQECFDKLKKDKGWAFLPEKLTACAGIAIAEAGRPLSMLNALAGDLCKHAKKSAKAGGAPYPSMLSFHVSTSSLREDYAEIEARELTAGDYKLSANPFLVSGTTAGCKEWSKLLEVAKQLLNMPRGRGKLVEALGLLKDDPVGAEDSWNRWRKVAKADDPKPFKSLEKLIGEKFGPAAGLISDALELIDTGAAENLA